MDKISDTNISFIRLPGEIGTCTAYTSFHFISPVFHNDAKPGTLNCKTMV